MRVSEIDEELVSLKGTVLMPLETEEMGGFNERHIISDILYFQW